MKGKLLIEPGFEAGSLFCGNCELRRYNYEMNEFFCNKYYTGIGIDYYDEHPMGYFRCQPCLDAEQETEEKK